MTTSAPIASASAAHQRLRRAILRLELAPATPVSEQRLAERFGLSKAAVRAALARLRAEGLAVAEPRRGHIIAPLTMRDVREVYELRLLVEPPAAAAAAGHVPATDLDRLVRRVDRPVDLDQASSVRAFLDGNRAVHVAIAAASGNRRLAELVERLLDESERAIAVALRAGAAGHGLRVRDEHLDLLTAVRAGSARQAERLMRTAIERFRDDLTHILGGSPTLQDTPLTPVSR